MKTVYIEKAEIVKNPHACAEGFYDTKIVGVGHFYQK